MSSFPISITWQVQTPPTASFDQLAKSAQSLDQAMASSAGKFDQFGQTVAQLDSPLSSVGGSMGELSGNMSQLEGSLGSAGSGMEELASATGDLSGTIGDAASGIEDAAGGMDDLSSGAGDAAGGMEDLASGAEDTGSALEDMSGSLEDTNTGLEETTGALEQTVPALEDTTTGLEDTSTALEDTVPALEDTNAALEETVPALEDTSTALEDTVPALEDTNTALEDTVPALEDTNSALEDTVPAVEDTATAFEDVVPAVEDTGTAFEDSAPAIDDTSTALEGVGTAAEDSLTATEDFTGALSGMDEANQGVTGGLTANNTLMGNLAGTTDSTAGSTNNLSGSFGKVALGMAGAAGAGVALFNMWDAVGDAQVAVDAANIRLERSQTMVDKAMLAVTRTLARLNSDMSLGVSGLGEYNAAWSAFNSLVESGVTTGATYEAALARLQAAHRGLSSTTQEGTQVITQLGIQVDTASQKIGLMGVASNNAANTLEAQNEAMTNLAFNTVPTAIAGIGSLSTTISDIPKSAHTAKVALLAVSGALSSTLVPALIAAKATLIGVGSSLSALGAGAALVAIGKVVLVLGAFTAAVTAIRANIKVFDDLGVKVGEVFPEMKGFLDDARQGFINLSDGINSAISFILGGLDSFAGGTTNLRAQWEGFTDTLPKGTGELGDAGLAMGQLGHITSATGEQINIGAGKWENMNGTLVAFGGAVKVAAGGWHELSDGTAVYSKSANEGTAATVALGESTRTTTTAMDAFGATGQSTGVILKEQSANYSELTNAQKLNVISLNEVIEGLSDEKLERFNAIKAAENYLVAHGTTAEAVGLSGDVLIGYVNALKSEGPAYSDSVQEATEYLATKHEEIDLRGKSEEWILKTAEALKEEDKALAKSTETTAKHVEELNKLHQGLVDGGQELAFYSDATNVAARMQLEFQTGVQEAQLALVDESAELKRSEGFLRTYIREKYGLVTATQTTVQELEALKTVLEAVTTAYAEGKASVISWAGELVVAAEHERGALDQMQDLIDALSVYFPEAASMTSEELQRLTEQVLQAGEGWEEYKEKVKEAITEAAEQFEESTGMMEEAFKRVGDAIGGDEWKEDLSEWEDDLDNTLAGMTIAVEEAFGTDIPDILAQFSGDSQMQFDAVRGYLDELKHQIDMNPEAWRSSFGEIEGILNDANLTVAEKMALIEANIAGLWERATPKLMAGAGIMTDAMEAFLGGEFLNRIEAALATKDPTAALLGYFKTLPQATQEQMSLFTGILKTAGGDVERAITTIVGYLQSQDIKIPESTINAMATAFNVPAETIRAKIAEMSGDIKTLPPDVKTAADEVGANINTVGAAGSAARAQWGMEIVAMAEVLRSFTADSATLTALVSTSFQGMAAFSGQELVKLATDITTFVNSYLKPLVTTTQSAAVTVSGAFNNMATNVNTSLVTAARGITTFQGILTNLVRASQSGATTVSGAFNNMATNVTSSTTRAKTAITTVQTAVTTLASTGSSRASSFASSFASAMSKVQSSASNAESSVKRLQSAINALKSKTITLTTIHRQVIQRVYAAQGGAFIAGSPTKIGPLNVSEFGQKELITVTPLENPSGQTITGPGMQVSTSGPGAKAFAKSGDKSISLGGGDSDVNARDLVKKIADFLEEKISSKRVESGKRVIKVEQPQIIALNLEGKQLLKYINKNLFEISDSILS